MRCLKVIAQDRFDNGRADCVLLEFHEQVGTVAGDRLVNCVFALDFTAEGKVDLKMGDMTNNDKEHAVDQGLLESFANAYLEFNWFNPGASRKQYLKLIAEDLQADGSPDVVRLQLCRESESKGIMISWSAAFDRDNDGKLDFSFHGDVNGDGRINKIDKQLVQRLAMIYLKFNWS